MSNSPLPPHDEQAEQAVLGCILIDADAILGIIDKLQPSDFYIGKHRALYSAMRELYNENQSIDLVTLPARCNGKFENIDSYIIGLINVVPTSVSVESYADVVYEKSQKRKILKAASEIAKIGYSDKKSKDAINEAQAAILGLEDGKQGAGLMTPHEHASKYMDRLMHKYENPDIFEGVPSGFIDLDRVLNGGFVNGAFHVISGRPGMGKTALAINIATHNAIELGKKVAFFSLEMSAEQLNNRIVSRMSGVESSRLRRSEFTENELATALECTSKLAESGLFIDETGSLNALDIRTRSQRMMLAHGLDLIIIDYLQIVSSVRNRENQNVMVSETCKLLRELAKELRVPILLLCQLSRNVESRSDKRPMNSDLRDSGQIEQDAHSILHLYRDEVYNPDTTDKPNIAEVIVGKNRDGETPIVELYWNGKYTSFANLQRMEIEL